MLNLGLSYIEDIKSKTCFIGLYASSDIILKSQLTTLYCITYKKIKQMRVETMKTNGSNLSSSVLKVTFPTLSSSQNS